MTGKNVYLLLDYRFFIMTKFFSERFLLGRCWLAAVAAVLTLTTKADGLDDIRTTLEKSSSSRVQEKVFLHTDNSCYFVGDTLWYKAYVVRADDLRPTHLSKILYVELLSPDGLLVERQNILVNSKGYTCGQFVLQDSLYSGYYELRAYTRWMLNFNVRQHRFSRHDSWAFYNKQMAADYFRIWDGLYSRVLPVYSKPETAGDYADRRMYQRPKTRIAKPKKDRLTVTFYPEGGNLVRGVENRVAFDIVDQLGEAQNIEGRLSTADDKSIELRPDYMGRGSFILTPGDKRAEASFTWKGKEYTFDLPKAEKEGVAIRLDDGQLTLTTRQLPVRELGLSVLCRGALKHFQRLQVTDSQTQTIMLPIDSLPTGVNELTIFDENGRIFADRLFFVNHHEQDANLITAPVEKTKTYEPYEKIELPVQCAGITEPTLFSLSIRDRNTEEPTYDNGDLMTDLLLSSELRGFIAYPAYYFETDDAKHRQHLDQLMMVQGWRKYKWKELSDSTLKLRYAPELSMTVEGAVYKTLNVNEVEPEEISSWQNGVGYRGRATGVEEEYVDPFAEETESEETIGIESAPETMGSENAGLALGDIEYGSIGSANDNIGVNHGNLRHDVLVEAEIIVDNQVAGSIQKTENGRFLFRIPSFYGDAYLNMKAYKENDSIKKSMVSRKDKKVLDENAFPDYYVKRDVFFPVYTHEYTFYEKHQPDIDEELLIDTLSDLSMENDVHELGTVTVKGRRRGRRAIDWKKPAFVLDAYELYNDITDRGLSYGKLDMRQFPVQVARFLFGNMNRYRTFHVDGRLEGHTYYRNYSPVDAHASEVEQASVFRANRTPQYIYNNLMLKRLQDIRVFTDFEPRQEDSTMVEERYSADVTIDLVPIPNDGKQYTYRDRHIVFHGFNYAEEFYQPDYSTQQPAEPTDYRRTLYWNPNAMTDENGLFIATFYNNSKQTRIKMTAAGVTRDGRLLHSK